jgi:hypothetical protein
VLDIEKDAEFREFIDDEIVNKPVEENDSELSIYNFCKQIDWNIKNINKTKMYPSVAENQGHHIMISYNSESRPLCLQVKADLEANGYKVWMDIQDIHGSSLDSMAKAVEDAAVILMCVTENYRASVNCQGEAQYAYRCNKPIIPCIMQQGAENIGGWLGFIMGDRKFVHFTKYDFGECMKRLKGEVDVYFKNAVRRIELPTLNYPAMSSNQLATQPRTAAQFAISPEKVNEVLKWDSRQVEVWFKMNQINLKILDHLHPCNGEILNQM